YPQSGRGWHTVFEGPQKILIQSNRLFVSALTQLQLFLKTLALIYRIVKLREGVAILLAITNRLEAFNQSGFDTMLFCQGRHLHRVVCNECRLNKMRLTLLTKNLINEFALTHRRVYGNM